MKNIGICSPVDNIQQGKAVQNQEKKATGTNKEGQQGHRSDTQINGTGQRPEIDPHIHTH